MGDHHVGADQSDESRTDDAVVSVGLTPDQALALAALLSVHADTAEALAQCPPGLLAGAGRDWPVRPVSRCARPAAGARVRRPGR
jgi:hypothetical protein